MLSVYKCMQFVGSKCSRNVAKFANGKARINQLFIRPNGLLIVAGPACSFVHLEVP